MGYGIREDMLVKLLKDLGGIKRQELAARAGLSPATITNAKNSRCRAETIRQLLERGGGVTDWTKFLPPDEKARLDGNKLARGVAFVPFCMFHRTRPGLRNDYYHAALASGRPVLYISIMSRNSFKMLKKHLTNDTRLRVLTWNPSSAEEVIGFSKHLQEEGDKLDQTQEALEEWAKLERDRPNIEVRTYDSTPTMQGIIVDHKWAMIELMPYATGPALRPAILLRYSEPAEKPAFNFFSEVFKSLFDARIDHKPNARASWFRSRVDARQASA